MKFNHIQQFFFLGLLLITSGVFLWMLGEYLLPVFWAVVIAIVFYPLYKRFEKIMWNKSPIASIATILSVILLVVLPLIFIGGMAVKESLQLYQNISESSNGLDSSSLIDRAGQFTAYLEPYGISQESVEGKLREWAGSVSRALASSLISFSQVTFSLIINTVIMLYLLFFFLRDGKRLQEILIHYLPLGDVYERRLLDRFSETTRAVMKGTFAIAILQGFIGGVTFWIVGVANPFLWGVAMALLAIIPVVGPAVIWLPAGIILLATGSIWPGAIILLVGTLLISLVDNLVRPIVVGRSSKMPDTLVLLATIGGLATFGVTGFIIGPIIAAFFLSLWTIFEERYHGELSKNK